MKLFLNILKYPAITMQFSSIAHILRLCIYICKCAYVHKHACTYRFIFSFLRFESYKIFLYLYAPPPLAAPSHELMYTHSCSCSCVCVNYIFTLTFRMSEATHRMGGCNDSGASSSSSSNANLHATHTQHSCISYADFKLEIY